MVRQVRVLVVSFNRCWPIYAQELVTANQCFLYLSWFFLSLRVLFLVKSYVQAEAGTLIF